MQANAHKAGCWEVFVAEESFDQIRVLGQYARRLPDIRITGAFQEGEAVLRALAEGAKPDALILNLCLLDMDALELLNRLQALPAACWLKVLVTSGGRNQAVHERLLSLGADYYMIKPYRMERLFDRLRLICQGSLDASLRLEDAIDLRLRQFGIWPGDDPGYLRRALCRIVTAKRQIRMVEDVYSAVAREAGVSLGAVDAGLRRTLKEIERIGTPEYCRLAGLARGAHKKITVGAFLNIVGQQIQQEQALFSAARGLDGAGGPDGADGSEEGRENGE